MPATQKISLPRIWQIGKGFLLFRTGNSYALETKVRDVPSLHCLSPQTAAAAACLDLQSYVPSLGTTHCTVNTNTKSLVFTTALADEKKTLASMREFPPQYPKCTSFLVSTLYMYFNFFTKLHLSTVVYTHNIWYLQLRFSDGENKETVDGHTKMTAPWKSLHLHFLGHFITFIWELSKESKISIADRLGRCGRTLHRQNGLRISTFLTSPQR